MTRRISGLSRAILLLLSFANRNELWPFLVKEKELFSVRERIVLFFISVLAEKRPVGWRGGGLFFHSGNGRPTKTQLSQLALKLS